VVKTMAGIKPLKQKAWKIFALYIKMRDADKDGMCECVTCGAILPFDSGDCQAGHFVTGRTNDVLFKESIVHCQCAVCNIYKNGNQGLYTIFMKKKYGLSDEDIEDMLRKNHAGVKLTITDLENIIDYSYTKIQEILYDRFQFNIDINDRAMAKIKKMGIGKLIK